MMLHSIRTGSVKYKKAAPALCALFFILSPLTLDAQQKTLIPIAVDKSGAVVIALKDLNYEAKFFKYQARGAAVRFFALLDKAGKPHVAFDACDVCYEARKGYRVINGQTICNNCGNRYPLTAIGTDNIAGGCWPSYLAIQNGGGKIKIKSADIDKKKYLFP